ncbi:MAG: hypothetical protein SOW56_07005 [Bacteroidaceae bacterium]|nr:hypothetical protein [Bacteroidaceae bacterium]
MIVIEQKKNSIPVLILAVVFIFSALSKSVNMDSFASEVLLYIEEYLPSVFLSFYKECAFIVCSVEMFVALLLLNRCFVLVALYISLILLLGFVFITGINLFFPSMFGSIESCGCFGEVIHFTPKASFVKSVLMWLYAGVLVVIQTKKKCSTTLFKMIRDRYLYLCLFLCVLPSLYSLIFLEKIDNGFYLGGYILLCLLIVCGVFFLNVFVKPNEQSQACLGYAMARKRN